MIPRLAQEPPAADSAPSSVLDPLPLPTFPVMPYMAEVRAPASTVPMQAPPVVPLPDRDEVTSLATRGVISNLFSAFAEVFQVCIE